VSYRTVKGQTCILTHLFSHSKLATYWHSVEATTPPYCNAL